MSACLAPQIIELQCPHKVFFQQDGGGGVPVGQKLGLGETQGPEFKVALCLQSEQFQGLLNILLFLEGKKQRNRT